MKVEKRHMWVSALVLALAAASARGHGLVLQPPSRASAWRQGFPTPPDYDDDGVNCGGLYHQWGANEGRCGVCGDAYELRRPRPHELGGRFGQGVIVAHYEPGSVIPVTVVLTASHQGHWEFKLCPEPESSTQECFDQHPLELENGGTKYQPKRGSTTYNLRYRLPENLVCEHCVLQWKYIAGNNWGVCSNGSQGLGCGPQEQFGACSDVSVGLALYGGAELPRQPHPVRLAQDYNGLSEGLKQFLRQNALAAKIAKKKRLKNKYKKKRLNSKKPGQKRKLKKHKNRKRKKYMEDKEEFEFLNNLFRL